MAPNVVSSWSRGFLAPSRGFYLNGTQAWIQDVNQGVRIQILKSANAKLESANSLQLHPRNSNRFISKPHTEFKAFSVFKDLHNLKLAGDKIDWN